MHEFIIGISILIAIIIGVCLFTLRGISDNE